MKKYFFMLSLIYLSGPIVAQLAIDTTKHLKLERRKGKDFRTLILENKNLIVLHNSVEPAKAFNRVLYFYYFDQDLKQVWNSNVTIPQFSKIIDWRSTAKVVYLLIQTTANHKYKFLKVHLETDSARFEMIEWKNVFKRFIINTFLILEHKFLLVGSIDNKPNITYFDLASQNKRFAILPSINQLKKTKLYNIHIDYETQIITVLLHRAGRILEKTLYVNQYDFEGRILRNTIVELNRIESLLTFRMIKLKSPTWLIFGTYSYKYQKKAQGIYCFKMSEAKIVSQKFYPFHTFKHIFKDMKPKRVANLKQRIARRARSSKSLPYAYHLIFHKLYYDDREIIALGEIVDLENPNENREVALPRNRFNYDTPVTPTYQPPNYNGTYRNDNLNLEILELNQTPVTYYKYKKAFICSFNLEGRLKWDNLFVFPKNTRSVLPQDQLTFEIMNDSLLFIQNHKIETNYTVQALTQFNPEAELQKLDSTLNNKNYDFSFYESGGVKHWFGNYFLGQGVRGYNDQERRTNANQGGYGFFYLHKISYRQPTSSSPPKFHYIEY